MKTETIVETLFNDAISIVEEDIARLKRISNGYKRCKVIQPRTKVIIEEYEYNITIDEARLKRFKEAKAEALEALKEVA